ncbi:MAG TPA: hypothetical protein VMG58_10050 [Candidatus Sulfotelmatobacter sp.]|nr:hypothetical protein [Candidatus Sulfotelmatobacter sp.]
MDVKRNGPPRAVRVAGQNIYDFEVTLNQEPNPNWIAFFRNPSERSTVCVPRLLRFEGSTLHFRSGQEDVPSWISYIDSWIAAANTAYAELGRRARESEERERLFQQQHEAELLEINERFKNL